MARFVSNYLLRTSWTVYKRTCILAWYRTCCLAKARRCEHGAISECRKMWFCISGAFAAWFRIFQTNIRNECLIRHSAADGQCTERLQGSYRRGTISQPMCVSWTWVLRSLSWLIMNICQKLRPKLFLHVELLQNAVQFDVFESYFAWSIFEQLREKWH